MKTVDEVLKELARAIQEAGYHEVGNVLRESGLGEALEAGQRMRAQFTTDVTGPWTDWDAVWAKLSAGREK